MKKSLFFVLTLTYVMQARAGFFGKLVNGIHAIPTHLPQDPVLLSIGCLLAASITSVNAFNVHDSWQAWDTYKFLQTKCGDPERWGALVGVLLDDAKQQLLRNRLSSIYCADKPLFFCIMPPPKGDCTINAPDADFIFIRYDSIMACLGQEIPWTDKRTAEQFFASLDNDQFMQAIEKHLGIILHEVGHVVHSHCLLRSQLNLATKGATTCLGLAITACALHNARRADPLTAIIQSDGAYTAVLALWLLQKLYYFTALAKNQEREADAYACKHATVDQLEYMHQLRKNRNEDCCPNKSFLVRCSDYVDYLISREHPTDAERLATLEKAIAAKKDRA